jgi:hypothetical protein
MTDKKVLQILIAQGQAGAGLVDSLVKGGDAAIQKYTDVKAATQKARDEAELFSKAYGSTTAIENIMKVTAGASPMGQGAMTAFQKELNKGAGVFELAAKFKISESALLAEQKRLEGLGDAAADTDIKASWSKDSLAKLKGDLDDALGVQEWVISNKKKNGGIVTGRTWGIGGRNKDGGIVKRAMGGIVGHFADGYSGRVSGPGTARSDQIPAMISNGEFVMNARATAANLDLLNAMNSNKNVSGAMGNQIGITINAAPGMDPTQIAQAVAAELNNQLSRGASI